MMRNVIINLGSFVLNIIAILGRFFLFLARILRASGMAFKRFYLTVDQIHFIGNYSLLIVLVSGLFVGFVLGLQGYNTLATFGSAQQLGLVVALSLLRELGPVITALLFAGRVGTSVTAEIGLMKAGEQLTAIEVMGINPLARIIAPRFLGGVIAMPVLASLFSAVGILGGWLVGVMLLGVDNGAYWSLMESGVNLFSDVGSGFVKSVVFGVACILVALYQGWYAKATPSGVSRATTHTVVISALLIFALDFVMTALMF
ncbi:lipid asymmetry maintenance ABC transporter permease subunit MlaE [Basilea psittacipulmonis]|uniref:Intermembrane phospholipid transport system permease protein MlaE n=1 Tax=Basilea psittacipulmonis DSM 24701 TaxID=1072685 RepID=A0A077DER7_9BURK|nr:lipid asymmetry maintenance ABC transporter permease subunit MlaE [Basilea psittacipulmonis]AIL33330.1 ABC transporter permease [Basilea psittacipulmonis DSM 24701]